MMKRLLPITLFAAALAGCGGQQGGEQSSTGQQAEGQPAAAPATGKAAKVTDQRLAYVRKRLGIYTPVELTADMSDLSDNQRQMVGKLIDAAKIMDGLFWRQDFGSKHRLLAKKIQDKPTRHFARVNYGPWDRLNGDKPFVQGVGPKPPGANFYPKDMTKAEFEAADLDGKTSQYTLLRRGDDGKLQVVPYSQAYGPQLEKAAGLLREAAGLADNKAFADYLKMRADALLSDDYRPSDMAWMDMKDNHIDLVYGPIETYEDKLYGYKASFEAFVLIKDMAWSERLARFAQFLPELQKGLPVPDEYKQEKPGTDADLNAYDAVYYAGDANAGAKTIAINLPNDEKVQLEKGTRRLQLKNAMRAKFDKILVPIADQLMAADQRDHITFDAFFQNTMFHEVAHGLGIKNTLDGKSTVREALKENASAMEEGKADILGLYMIQKLRDKGEISDGEMMDNYVTFLASTFRSVRFGASDAHGRANMARFNFFKEQGAFTRDPDTGTYRVNKDAFEKAMTALSRKILTLQGDGDYQGASEFLGSYGKNGPTLQSDLNRLGDENIPVDVVFRQGKDVLGLGADAPAASD